MVVPWNSSINKGKKPATLWATLAKGKKEDTPILYALSHTHTTKNPTFKCNDLVETDLPAEFRQLELGRGFPNVINIHILFKNYTKIR